MKSEVDAKQKESGDTFDTDIKNVMEKMTGAATAEMKKENEIHMKSKKSNRDDSDSYSEDGESTVKASRKRGKKRSKRRCGRKEKEVPKPKKASSLIGCLMSRTERY